MAGSQKVKFTKSLQFTISVILLAVTLTIMAVFLGVQYFSERNKEIQKLTKTTENTAHRMSQYLANPMWAVEKNVIDSFLEAEMLDDDVFGIIVFDSNGKAVVSGKSRDTSWNIYSTYDVFKKNKIDKSNLIITQKDIFMPGVNDKKLGSVKVFVSKKFITSEVNKFFAANALSVVILAFVLIFAITLSIRKLLLNPFEKLIYATEKMSMGDLKTSIDIESENEIGVLVTSIERMRQSMIMAFHRLKKKQQR